MFPDTACAVNRVLLIELVGPAGAGKSTVARRICAVDPRHRVSLGLWGLPRRFLLASVIAHAPDVIASLLARKSRRRTETMQVIRLEALLRAVRAARRRGVSFIVLDEGPVFCLAWLDLWHSAEGDARRTRWRRSTMQKWARLLSAVVYLDAEDDVLIHRIRTRSKPHPVRNRSDEEIRRFTWKFRAAFGEVIAKLRTTANVTVVDLRPVGEACLAR